MSHNPHPALIPLSCIAPVLDGEDGYGPIPSDDNADWVFDNGWFYIDTRDKKHLVHFEDAAEGITAFKLYRPDRSYSGVAVFNESQYSDSGVWDTVLCCKSKDDRSVLESVMKELGIEVEIEEDRIRMDWW